MPWETRTITAQVQVWVDAPPPPDGVVVTATPRAGGVAIEWEAVAGAGSYVVGRDGTDTTGTGPWSTTVPAGTLTWVFDHLSPGVEYEFTVLAVDDTGQVIVEGSVLAAPLTTTPPPPPPPPSGGVNPDAVGLVVGASGMAWDTLLGGSAPIKPKRDAFEAWLGRPMDGSESFPGRKTWDNMSWIDPAFASLPGIRAITLPCQPQGPNKDQDNTLGASGEFNWWWREYGEKLVALGYNTHLTRLRLNHEPNPSPYAWHSWNMGAGGPKVGPERFRQAVINAATSVRETAPNVLIVLNLARGNFDTSYTDGATWAEVLDPLMALEDTHGNPLISAVTSDSYDNSPGVTPHGQDPGEAGRLKNWRIQTNGVDSDTPPGRDQGFGIPCRGTIYAFCEWWTRERGAPVWFMHPEWGLSHRDDSRGGDDDPHYIELMHAWFSERAVGNRRDGLMLSESYFNHAGAPDKNKHEVLNYGTGQIPAHNTNGGRRYRELWGARH